MCYNINDTFQINKSVFDMILGNNRQKRHETWLKETKWKTNEDIGRRSCVNNKKQQLSNKNGFFLEEIMDVKVNRDWFYCKCKHLIIILYNNNTV